MTQPSHQAAMQQAARHLLHAADPVRWATDVLHWHADPWQAQLLRSTAHQMAVPCSRQSGKSTTVSVLAAHVAVFQPQSLTLITSPGQRQASELLKRVRGHVAAVGAKPVSDAATLLELQNGARVISLPASPDLLRGYSAPTLLIIDEAAFCPDELYYALRPMMAAAPRCRMVLLSTFNMRSGFFWDATLDRDFEVYKVTAHDCPRIGKDFLAAELAKHGQRYYDREYMCIASDGEYQFFDSELLAAAFNCDAQPLRARLFT